MAVATLLVVAVAALGPSTQRGGPKPRRPYYSRQENRGPRRGTDTRDQERRLDLFGPEGEWRARKGGHEWSKYRSTSESDGSDGFSPDDTAPPPDFAPKVWRTEAGGGRAASFFAKSASFADLGATADLDAALGACGAERPSHIQAAGFAPILAGNDVVLADQTGSGKTLAYLAPIVQSLRQLEASEGRTADKRVRALILTPTSELAQQVLSVAKSLSSAGVPLRSSIITGEHKWRTQARCAERGLELLVATPGRLRAHLQAEPASFSLADTRHVVLDEADLLLEDDDFDQTWEVLREALPDAAATAFVTATLPNWLVERVQSELPLIKQLQGPALHRTGVGVREQIIDCSAGERQRGDGDAGFRLKATALMQQLVEEPADRVLIFCNTIESCRRVENYLRRRDRRHTMYDVQVFHGAIPADARKRALSAFTAPKRADGAYSLPRLLVCTDRASRGMDFEDVGHVVLFDFPRDGIEYVRRVGRVTRGARAPGRVTSLVLGRQLAYARELMKINREGGTVDLDVHGH